MAYDYKQDFPLLRALDVAYIDNAATAQRPQCVLDAENDFYCRHNANPLRGLYPLSVEATDAYEAAREAVRDFLGAASTQEIIFTRNTTESLNLVAYSYGLSHIKTGDEVVVSIMEHHSNLLPWQMVCRQTGATLKFMECEPDGSLDLHKVEQLITERTKLVALTQVSNVLGRQYPVREIAAMAHKKGAVIVVDGAQSTPHIPVNVRELGADFLAFSGHKLYGPMGIGGLYGRRELLDEMPPFLCGRRDDRDGHARGRDVCRASRTSSRPAPSTLPAPPGCTPRSTMSAASASTRSTAARSRSRPARSTKLRSVPHVHILGSEKPEEHCGHPVTSPSTASTRTTSARFSPATA